MRKFHQFRHYAIYMLTLVCTMLSIISIAIHCEDTIIPGLSAYEIAVKNGFVGTEEAWLASLNGAKGEQGKAGPQGVAGPKGDKGDDGITTTYYVHQNNNWVFIDYTEHEQFGDPFNFGEAKVFKIRLCEDGYREAYAYDFLTFYDIETSTEYIVPVIRYCKELPGNNLLDRLSSGSRSRNEVKLWENINMHSQNISSIYKVDIDYMYFSYDSLLDNPYYNLQFAKRFLPDIFIK